jgi:hypothetical protein
MIEAILTLVAIAVQIIAVFYLAVGFVLSVWEHGTIRLRSKSASLATLKPQLALPPASQPVIVLPVKQAELAQNLPVRF